MRPNRRQVFVISSIVTLAALIIGVTLIIILMALDAARSSEPVSTYFVIENDESVDSIAERLDNAGLIKSPMYFTLRVRLESKGDDIVAGRYRLDTGMSTGTIIDVITSENAAVAQEISVRFIEGWRTEQFGQHAVDSGFSFSVDDFMAATEDTDWNRRFAFLHTRPSGVALEGYLFPDTYNFRVSATPEDVIDLLLTTFELRVTREMMAKADAQGMSLHQVITLASIIEREAAVDVERTLISSVYRNRLERGMPLQADPTIQYQIGTAQEWWPGLTPADLQRNGVYNTYLNPSLPPGPICNPSLASIVAALEPEETNFLYFVAVGDGTHAFAETYEEHQQNIRRYHGD